MEVGYRGNVIRKSCKLMEMGGKKTEALDVGGNVAEKKCYK